MEIFYESSPGIKYMRKPQALQMIRAKSAIYTNNQDNQPLVGQTHLKMVCQLKTGGNIL